MPQTTSVLNKSLLHKTAMISVLKPRYVELTHSLLHQKYVVEDLQTRELSELFFSSRRRILDALKRHNIPLKKRKNTSFNRTNTPFGKKLLPDGQLEDCPIEMKTVDLMIKMKDQGFTYKAICEELQKREIKTKTGKTKWSPESVKRAIIRR